jgi:hypothetical protein
MIRNLQFNSTLKRFFPKFEGASLRYYQTAPLYDVLEAPHTAETRFERLSNAHSVENLIPPPQPPLVNTRWDQLLQPKIKALLVDAAGTLLSPSEPAAEVSILKYLSHFRGGDGGRFFLQ